MDACTTLQKTPINANIKSEKEARIWTTMKLYIIRHGESEGNRQQILQGDRDLGLTKKGEKQAEELAEQLKDKKIVAIYTSQLQRAYQTADIIAESHKLVPVRDARLNAMRLGHLEGKKIPQLGSWLVEVLEKLKNFEDVHDHQGESQPDVVKRVKPVLQEIRMEHRGEDDIVCIVTHHITKRAIIKALTNLPQENLKKLSLKNTSTSIFEIHGEKVDVIELDQGE